MGCCGLDCSECETFLATQADDDEQRRSVAANWSKTYNADIKPEQINCDGCRGDGRKFIYCEQMCQVRRCCQEKTRDNCAECDLYACEKVEKIHKAAPGAKANLDELRK